MAGISHLRAQQFSKSGALGGGIVVAVLFMRQQRVRGFVRDVSIEIILLQIRGCLLNDVLFFGRIERCAVA